MIHGKCGWKKRSEMADIQHRRSIDWCNTRPDPNPIRLPGTKDFPYFPPSRGRWLSVFVAHYHCLLIKIGRSHWNHWSLIPEDTFPGWWFQNVSNMLKSPVPSRFWPAPAKPGVPHGVWTDVDQCSCQLCRLYGAQWLRPDWSSCTTADWWRVYLET